MVEHVRLGLASQNSDTHHNQAHTHREMGNRVGAAAVHIGDAPANDATRDADTAAEAAEADAEEGLTEAERAARMHVLDEAARARRLTDYFTADGAVLGRGAYELTVFRRVVNGLVQDITERFELPQDCRMASHLPSKPL